MKVLFIIYKKNWNTNMPVSFFIKECFEYIDHIIPNIIEKLDYVFILCDFSIISRMSYAPHHIIS